MKFDGNEEKINNKSHFSFMKKISFILIKFSQILLFKFLLSETLNSKLFMVLKTFFTCLKFFFDIFYFYCPVLIIFEF